MFRLVQIAPGAYVASSSLYLTNSVVIEGLNHNVLVIDPAVTVQELMMLGVDLRQAGMKTELGFSTHPHWDHVLWSPALGNLPRYATGRAIQSLRTHRDIMFAEMMQAEPRATIPPCSANSRSFRQQVRLCRGPARPPN